MDDCWRRPRALPSVRVLACMLLDGPAAASPPDSRDDTALRQLVAVAIVRRGDSSPRFELKVSVGLWKPKTNHVGMKAGADRSP